MNIVIYIDFVSERFPLLVNYTINDCNEIDISAVRLIRKVVNGGEVYNLPSGFCKNGPVYEAAWLHGQAGTNHILSPAQLVAITKLTEEALRNPHFSIPEDQIVHPLEDKNYGKP